MLTNSDRMYVIFCMRGSNADRALFSIKMQGGKDYIIAQVPNISNLRVSLYLMLKYNPM